MPFGFCAYSLASRAGSSVASMPEPYYSPVNPGFWPGSGDW